ncbi:MAG TPA: molybdenum cofactor biosynthesis protein MoaB [Candidatus Bathyarchaeota archaeon]|nr:molybdenum cofactor biosynthesis protein MoaB [Candidatus Bathyarchaeota archaeon]
MSETSRKHKSEAPSNLNYAVIVGSTSRYERLRLGGEVEDPSGDLIENILKSQGHEVSIRKIVPDKPEMIREALEEAISSREVDVILTCGGTGITSSDVTIETVKPMLDKTLEGFGEIFRLISYRKIGSAAILTRALAGVSKGKAIFCIPGSPDAVKTALEELILKEAGHIVKHAREK